jgi:hypothetical protein
VTDAGDVALGLALAGARVGLVAGRIAALPLRLAAQAPVIGAPLRSAARDLAAEGGAARRRVIAAIDVDRLVDAVLEDPRTERALERALESSGLERLVVRVFESRFLDDLTERVLQSPEMQRVIEHIAGSPEVLEAVSQQTETLAEEMVFDVRRRAQRVDDLAERTVRGWLRRPRPRST